MFTRHDIAPLSVAVATAAAAGLALGLWLTLPSTSVSASTDLGSDPDGQTDPNLAQYRQMAAANGVGQAPYLMSANFTPPADPLPASVRNNDEAPHEDVTASAGPEMQTPEPNLVPETPPVTARDPGETAVLELHDGSQDAASLPSH